MEVMMKNIHSRHERGNSVGFLKLPLIFTDPKLWAGAIGQFYVLTKTLEDIEGGEMLQFVRRSLSHKPLAQGYASDLQQLLGTGWESEVMATMQTDATREYVEKMKRADDCSLCSAVFILYGALMIGGGKATQRKVKKIPALRHCDHVLFDVEMSAKARFRSTFDALAEKWPGEIDKLAQEARNWMDMNNKVVISVKCTPWWAYHAVTAAVGLAGVAGYFWLKGRGEGRVGHGLMVLNK